MSETKQEAEVMRQASSPLDSYFEALLSPVERQDSDGKPKERKVDHQPAEGETAKPPIVLPPGCPAWVEGPFAIQPFRLGGLRFAVPEFQLHSLIPWPRELATHPDQPAWALGQLDVEGSKIWVVDTLNVILPPGKRSKPVYRLLLAGAGMALACDAAEDEIILNPDQVKWRQERTHRPWLLGMLATAPCALIDFEKVISN